MERLGTLGCAIPSGALRHPRGRLPFWGPRGASPLWESGKEEFRDRRANRGASAASHSGGGSKMAGVRLDNVSERVLY